MTAIAIPSTGRQVSGGDRAFLGHPRGLAYLAFAELWERFSYYGMTALLAGPALRRALSVADSGIADLTAQPC